MGRLTVEVPSIDTEDEYEIGQGLRIQKGMDRSTGRHNTKPGDTWHAEVVAKSRSSGDMPLQRTTETTETTEGERGNFSGLPPITHDGRSEYVRRVVVELRSDIRGRVERAEDGLQVYTLNSEKVRSKVLKVFDIKDMID